MAARPSSLRSATASAPAAKSGTASSAPRWSTPITRSLPMARLDWRDTLPPALLESLQLMPFEQAVRLLHNPPPDVDESALEDRSHPAWVRMKFDELLAQQLSLKRAQDARRAKGAAPL